MEKIRSAIAKARAERDALEGSPVIRQQDMRAGDKSLKAMPLDGIGANWDALPVAHFDTELMRLNRIVAHERGQESTSIDMLRTKIVQQMRDNNWRRLAITSPTAMCGKSTIALNLAVSLSRQRDLKTLLLELDLRRPSLLRMLGTQSSTANLVDVLRGKVRFADCAVRYGDNLAVCANRGKTTNAAELLGSEGVATVLTGIEADYQPDIVIFDMPPTLVADDMMAFATQVDCVLIIAAAEKTTTKEIDLCEQELARQTNIMGVVLNGDRHMEADAGYDY